MSRPLLRSRVIERSPIPYAWVVLAAAAVGVIMTTPGQTVGVSVFIDRIIADLGISRATVSLLYTVGTLAGSLALPFVGRFIDRRGPRLSVILISAAFALACVYMGQVRSLAAVALGFVLIRGLGQGSLSLVSLHVVNVWFVRRRGLAVGLLGLGFAVATAFFPPLIESAIDAFGWRRAYALLGLLVAVTILPLGALLFRGHPERFGRLPDTGRLDGADPTAPPTPAEADLTLGEARRSAAFWLFAGGDIAIAALSTALVFHHFDLMAAGGLDRAAAAALFVPLGAATAGANLLGGVLMDRVRPRYLLAAMLGLMAAALLLAGLGSGGAAVLVYGGLLGAASGTRNAVSGAVYAHLFGRLHIGSIKGLANTLTVAGTAAGPLLLALGRDAFGSYGPALVLLALPPAGLALAALTLRTADRPPAPVS